MAGIICKQKEVNMKLKKYLEERGMSWAFMARSIGVTVNKVYFLMRGGMPTLKTALLIEEFTHGEIKPCDLISEEKLSEIKSTVKKVVK
jgi:hypothetical protein